jgi:5'-3' exonuclease
MGIPAYFSYIIKNHSNIVKNYKQYCESTRISTLFIDSNSIIYDIVHSLPEEQSHEIIIDLVIKKIKYYIQMILPTSLTYIAFDGIAPFAKMEQQKTRRYKSAFLQRFTEKKMGFNTINITPGTPFMDLLSKRIHSAFYEDRVIVSTSMEFGEGEHKLCQYLREHSDPNENVVIYGLDADLIMLALFHQKYSKNIFVCREKPAFIGKSEAISDSNELLFLDTKELSNRIIYEMNCKDNSNERVYDYVFLCFFLGNDFLPHFPSLNIRTSGIDRLMDTYREHIGKYPNRRFLSRDGEILWKWVHLFVKELALNEREFLIQEYDVRGKWEHQTRRRLGEAISSENLEERINSVPVLFREIEHYICPHDLYWEKRYYNSLFDETVNIRSVCINYLEGLEWVYTYYTRGCKNTRWKYNYNYPPLLKDLVQHIPTIEKTFVTEKHDIISQKEQLEYIIPPELWKELGLKLQGEMVVNTPMSFSWSFNRYFWEAHIKH